jgi:hypothetical protein
MKKLGLICLVTVIIFGSLGAGYSAWSQDLSFSGSVSTGTFDVAFDSVTAPGAINGATFSTEKINNYTYNISLNNLYPSLDAVFTFVLKNTGTIPAKITDIKIDGHSIANTAYQYSKYLGTDHTTSDITISVTGITTSTTIGAGNMVSGALTVHTWSLAGGDANDATAQASGIFTLEIDTAQRY